MPRPENTLPEYGWTFDGHMVGLWTKTGKRAKIAEPPKLVTGIGWDDWYEPKDGDYVLGNQKKVEPEKDVYDPEVYV